MLTQTRHGGQIVRRGDELMIPTSLADRWVASGIARVLERDTDANQSFPVAEPTARIQKVGTSSYYDVIVGGEARERVLGKAKAEARAQELLVEQDAS